MPPSVGQGEAWRLAARRLWRLLGAGDREQRLQHVWGTPAVTARGELAQTLRAQRADQRGRDVAANLGRAAIHEPDVAMTVEQRKRRRVRVSARELDAERLPEGGQLVARSGRELPCGARSIPVVEEHGGGVHVRIGRDLCQRYRGRDFFRELEKQGGVQRARFVASGVEGRDHNVFAGSG